MVLWIDKRRAIIIERSHNNIICMVIVAEHSIAACHILSFCDISDHPLLINLFLTAQHRGSISAEHGLGLKKLSYIHHSKSALAVELMGQFKLWLDPNGILNPYKTIPNPHPPRDIIANNGLFIW